MTELEEIRQRKSAELKQRQEQAEKEEEAEQKIDSTVKQLLTEGARARLENVKLVNKETYLKAVQAVIYLFNAGQVSGKIDELQLKELLKKFSGKREIQIKRK